MDRVRQPFGLALPNPGPYSTRMEEWGHVLPDTMAIILLLLLLLRTNRTLRGSTNTKRLGQFHNGQPVAYIRRDRFRVSIHFCL